MHELLKGSYLMTCEFTNLNLSGELIVAEDMNSGELSHLVELKFDLDRLPGPRVVPPTNPALAWNKILYELHSENKYFAILYLLIVFLKNTFNFGKVI